MLLIESFDAKFKVEYVVLSLKEIITLFCMKVPVLHENIDFNGLK